MLCGAADLPRFLFGFCREGWRGSFGGGGREVKGITG